MSCYIDELPVELVLHLLQLTHFGDRDALLAMRPDARKSYLMDLRKQYDRAQLLRVARFLGHMATRVRTVRADDGSPVEYPLCKEGDGHIARAATFMEHARGPATPYVPATGDFWRASIVVGTNIQWLEIVLGNYRCAGTRVYYRQSDKKDEPRILKYVCPDSDCKWNAEGLPVATLCFTGCVLRCNDDGVIWRAKHVYEVISDDDRTRMLSSDPMIQYPVNARPRMVIKGGIARYPED